MPIEYHIKIENELKNESNESINNIGKESSEDKVAKKVESASSKSIAAYIGKQIAQTAISNFGDLTGNYLQQANVNSMIEIGASIAMVAKGGYLGIAMVVANVASKAVSYGVQTVIADREAEMLKIRTGGGR